MPALGHVLEGSLQVQLLELGNIEEESVCHLVCGCGGMEKKTPSRLSAARVEETFHFPVTKDAAMWGDRLVLSLWTSSRKLSSVEVPLRPITETRAGNDMWLKFENSGKVHVIITFLPFRTDCPPLKPPARNSQSEGAGDEDGDVQDDQAAMDATAAEAMIVRGPPRLTTKDLQEMYGEMSIADIYTHQCVNYCSKKPNSSALKALPSLPSTKFNLTQLSFSSVMLGDRGVLPLLETVRVCIGLRVLNLDGNDMSCFAADAILRTLRHHPTLTSLSVCDNRFYETAGERLLLLLRSNQQITSLKNWGNDFTPYLVKRIGTQQERNAEVQQHKSEAERDKMRLFLAAGVAIKRPDHLRIRTRQLVAQTWRSILESKKLCDTFCQVYQKRAVGALDAPERGIDPVLATVVRFMSTPVGLFEPGDKEEAEDSGKAGSESGDGGEDKLFIQVLINTLPPIDPYAQGRDWESVEAWLDNLGKLYFDSGVRLVHYEMMESVILMALEKTLGRKEFNPELEQCWREVLCLVTRAMTRNVPERYT